MTLEFNTRIEVHLPTGQIVEADLAWKLEVVLRKGYIGNMAFIVPEQPLKSTNLAQAIPQDHPIILGGLETQFKGLEKLAAGDFSPTKLQILTNGQQLLEFD